jgi:hypothetical protein
MAVEVAAPPEEITEDALSEWPYRFEIVPVAELTIDKDYQRGLTSFWQTVAEKFNPALVGTLIVSERGKRKNVVDGQTRLKAMTEIGKTAAPCLIYEGLSKKQEALLFSLLQTQRRNMTTYERFRAQLVAGEEMAIGISTIAQEVGFELSAKQTNNTIRAISALERMWRIDPEHLREILELVRDIWGVDNRDAVSAQILTGLSTFVRNQTSIDYDRLRKRLADVTPALIINRAAQIREGAGWGTGAGKSVSQAILAEYMRRR